MRADRDYNNGAIGWYTWGGRRGYGFGTEVKSVKHRMPEDGKGRVRLNAERGYVGLSVGPGNFAML